MKIILIGAGFIAAFVTWHVHAQNKEMRVAMDRQQVIIAQQQEQLRRDERIMTAALLASANVQYQLKEQ